MKKAIVVILLLAVCFCVSCTPETDRSDENWSDGYIYFYRNTLLRINVETATAVPVCPDPLCKHNDDTCPFYGAGTLMEIAGKYAVYIKSGDSGAWGGKRTSGALCAFNFVTGKYKTLYEPDGNNILTNVGGFLVYDGYVYFNITVMKNNSMKQAFYPARADIVSGKVKYLSDTPSDESFMIYAADDTSDGTRIYWGHYDDYYSTDTDGGNRIDGEHGYSELSKIGSYYYNVEMNGEVYKSQDGGSYPYYKMTRTDSETGEVIPVLDSVKQVLRIYGGKILYMKYDDEPTFLGSLRSTYEDIDGIKDDILKIYDDSAGKVYCCEPDGSGERLLCDFSGTKYYIHEISSAVQTGVSEIGDWIVTEVFTYIPTKEEGFVTRGDNAILLLNMKTGEYKEVTLE